MDPQTTEPSQHELPPVLQTGEDTQANTPEALSGMEALPPAPQGPSTGFPSIQQMQSATQAAATPAQDNATQAPTDNTPAVADDLDLIEKEWVDKAKQIVAETRNDPYMQNDKMSKYKANYIKKRYGMNIKVGDS